MAAVTRSTYAVLAIGQADSPETFVPIEKQTDFNLSMSASEIDVANKGTGVWGEKIAGLREFVVRGSNYIDTADANGWDKFNAQALALTTDNYRALLDAALHHYAFAGQVLQFEITGPNQQGVGANWSVTLSSGEPVYG